jgi:hypothetical protein
LSWVKVPRAAFVVAAAFLTIAKARSKSGKWLMETPEIGKFSRALWVWVP